MIKANLMGDAINVVRPNSTWSLNDPFAYEDLVWRDEVSPKPDKESVMAEYAKLITAEPLRQLREKRNQLLTATDWMAVADRTMTQAQIDYRQALRDLPETAEPQLDEQGNLTNVTWPERPE